MRVCFVTASVSRKAGGLYEGVRRLAQCCANSELSVIGVEDEHTAADLPEWRPVPVRTSRVFGPERFSFAPGLCGGLLQTGAEIAHLHGLWRYPSVAVSRWHRRSGRPYIVHPHGMLDSWAVRNSGWKKKIASALFETATLRRAACLRALCRAEAEAIRNFGCDNPICIIPNGTDLPTPPFSEPGWRRCVSRDTKVLLYLGRIHPKKGLSSLLRAWHGLTSLLKESPEPNQWVLVIAGWDDGGHEVDLQQCATKLGIQWMDARSRHNPESELLPSGGLLFVGSQFGKNKSETFHHSDAFILPSLSEGLPMAVLEAWSHGKSVLMTKHCNLPEGFECGAAMRIGTEPEDILPGLKRLHAATSDERRKMGAQGLRLVTEQFNWKRVSEQLMAVSHWTLSGGVPPETVWAH